MYTRLEDILVCKLILKITLPLLLVYVSIIKTSVISIEFTTQSTQMKIEEPPENHQPIQCLRCQGFGSINSYCNHPYTFFHCGNSQYSHTSDRYQKYVGSTTKCAFSVVEPSGLLHGFLCLQKKKNPSYLFSWEYKIKCITITLII